MVLDTRSLDSFYDLAAVVRDFTTPSRGGRELTREEENQACRLRAEQGWHAWHIAEAMGLARGNHSYQWQDNIVEALEGCMYRRDWGGSSARVIRGIGRTAARGEELHPSEVTVEGTNTHSEWRKTAKTNAIVEALLSPGQMGTRDIPGVGQTPRQRGRPAIKAGKDKTAKELAAQADRILADQKKAGHYPQYAKFPNVSSQDINREVQNLGELFDWVGRQRSAGWSTRPPEEKKKIDAEIIRRCKEQALKTPAKPPWGFYARMAKEVYETTPCCGPDGTETMDAMEYTKFQASYVNTLCVGNSIFQEKQQSVADAVADPVNIKKVEAAIVTLASKRRAWQVLSTEAIPVGASPLAIMAETGLRREIVERILANLGYVTLTTRTIELRAIILPLHDKKLTPYQMWDETPELQKQWPIRRIGTRVIRSMLTDAVPPREPWTDELLREERVLPIVADNLREMLQRHLRQEAQDDVWLARIRQNVRAQAPPGGIFESLGTEREFTVDAAAALIKETPAFTRKVIEVLAAETPQFVALRGEELVVPFSGLQWIVRGGE
jgi:hypothetical protein